MNRYRIRLLVIFCLLLVGGCSFIESPVSDTGREETVEGLASLGYAIQVGAFRNLDNAVRLMETLDRRGLDAYFYRHASGLYKVRFGDFASRKKARMAALALRNRKIIDAFYIVSPEDYALAELRRYNDDGLRNVLVETARGFIGIPYKWGGESAKTGFDCSGLTMTVYKLNGLRLPRNSRVQYRSGTPVDKVHLLPGDLVFFATNGGRRVTHVGIYTGEGRFIHAPRKGKRIRYSSLSSPYFRENFVGGRTYLRHQGLQEGERWRRRSLARADQAAIMPVCWERNSTESVIALKSLK